MCEIIVEENKAMSGEQEENKVPEGYIEISNDDMKLAKKRGQTIEEYLEYKELISNAN